MNKYGRNETMRIFSSSGIFFRKGSFLFLFGNKQ